MNNTNLDKDKYLSINNFIQNATGSKTVETVNLKSGKLGVAQHVFSAKGARLPLNLHLTYNPTYANATQIFTDSASAFTQGNLLAKGWKFNYQQFIRKQEDKYYYYDENFELHIFSQAQNSTSVYYDSTGQTGLLLTELQDNSGYEITDSKTLTYRFNAMGELVKIINKKGATASELNITYDTQRMQISSITDGAGRVFTLTYDTSGTLITLKRVIDTEEETLVELNINSIGQLNSVFYVQENSAVQFTYDSSNRIANVTNHVEKELSTINYYESGTVDNVENYKINGTEHEEKTEIGFAYDAKKTTLTNTIYQEQENGSILPITDTKYCYFAQNNELLYTVTDDPTPAGKDQTFADRMIDFLESTTFATADDFKEYKEALTSTRITKFVFNNGNNSYLTKLSLPVGANSTSLVAEDVTLSTPYEYLVMAKVTKSNSSTQTGSGNVVLKLDTGHTIEELTFNASDEHVKYKTITLVTGTYSFCVYAQNQDSEAINVEVWLCAKGEEEKHVVTKETNNPAILQCLQGGFNYWYEIGNCSITDGTNTIENVKYSYKDDLLTRMSYYKNPSSFNVWYNDRKNVITNCTLDTLKFKFIPESSASPWHNLISFNYAIRKKNLNTISYTYAVVSNNSMLIKTEAESSGTFKVEKATFNQYFNCVSQTDANNIITNYTYDTYGNVTLQKVFPSSDVYSDIEYVMTYSNGDQLASEANYKNALSFITNYAYDDVGNLIKITTPGGQVINNEYNGAQQLSAISATVNSQTNRNNLQYQGGTLSSANANSGSEYSFLYDKFNNLTSVMQNNVTLYSKKEVYNSDKSGYVEVSYANGYAERRYHDKYGHVNRICEVVNGEETELFIFIYGDLDKIEHMVNIDSIYSFANAMDLTVSKNSKLLKIIDKVHAYDYNSSVYNTWTYYYDAVGNLMHIKENKFGNQSYNVKITEKDENQRIIQKTAFFGSDEEDIGYYVKTKNVEYKNNGSNDIVSEQTEIGCNTSTYLSVTSNYDEDNLNRPIKSTVKDSNNNGYSLSLSYVPKLKKSSGGTINPPIEFGPMNAVTPSGPVTFIEDGTTNYIENVKTYNIVNGVSTLQKTEAVGYSPNGEITSYGNNYYSYDGIGRLIRENNADLGKTFTYGYDERGNLTAKKEYAYSKGALSNLSTVSTFIYDSNDRLISDDSNNLNKFTYDSLGNPINLLNKTYSWKGNKVSTVTKDSVTYNMVYDHHGLLHSKTYRKNNVNYSAEYYYDGNRRTFDLFYQVSKSLHHSLYYAYNKQDVVGFYYLDGIAGANGAYTFRKNLFGDITDIYQGTTCVAKYKYDAWGNCTVCNPDGTANTSETFIGNINPFRYRGYYWDKDLCMYYLQTRWYDPAIGRFISPDSVDYLDPESFGGLNLYAYCGNDPINKYDPTGHFAISLTVLGLIIGAAIGATAGGFAAYNIAKNNGAEGWELFGWTMAGIVGGGVIGGALGAGVGALVTKATGVIGLSITKYSIIPIKGTTVLGHMPGYIGAAQATGSGYYLVSNGTYYKMVQKGVEWINNMAYLKDANSLGSRFALAPDFVVREGGTFWKEILYLIENGIPWEMF